MPLIRKEEKLRNSLFTATTKEKEIIEAAIDELVERKLSLTNSDEYKKKEKTYKKYKEKYYEYIREKLNDKEQDLILAQDIYKNRIKVFKENKKNKERNGKLQMSTRLIIQNTTGNEMQLFGNNDVPNEIIKELERQELEFTQDTEYSPRQWNINEIQPIVNIIKDRFYKMLKTNKKVVDFSNYFYEKDGKTLKKKKDINLSLSTYSYFRKQLSF